MTFDLEKIKKACIEFPSYRFTQIKKEIFSRFVESFKDSINLPKDLISKLDDSYLSISAEVFQSKDKSSTRALLLLEDGEKVESVLIKSKERNTICVSTQVGCAMDCAFCASGKLGFTRNLTVSEIVMQVLFFARLLNETDEKITNVVFMGTGEPFLNYENVMDSINFLNEKEILNLGLRRFSISTSGVIKGIEKFTKLNSGINLAISLHAPNDDLRDKLMPVNKTNSLENLMATLKDYQEKTNRKIMFEYIMIDGVNDSETCAKELVQLVRDFICVVNLIPYNQTGDYKPSKPENIQKFKEVLAKNKIIFTQRQEAGSDIFAACGQLALKAKKI